MEHRVQKFIALSGLCSRRKAEELISEGKVTVNGKKISLGDKANFKDIIEVSGKKISFSFNFEYIVMNKKKGYITSKKDELNRKTVFDLLKPKDNQSNFFSIGRLDKDTTGLLIITNDGNFAQRIIHPSSSIPKVYNATLNRELNSKDLKLISGGLLIDKYKLKPCKIKKVDSCVYNVTIYEGRNRQIRKMFSQRGYDVIALHREKIGNLSISNFKLKQGDYIKLPKKELEKSLFNAGD